MFSLAVDSENLLENYKRNLSTLDSDFQMHQAHRKCSTFVEIIDYFYSGIFEVRGIEKIKNTFVKKNRVFLRI